jgi:hypothetical protein
MQFDGERVDVGTDKPFAEVVKALEAEVPSVDTPLLNRLVAEQASARTRRQRRGHGGQSDNGQTDRIEARLAGRRHRSARTVGHLRRRGDGPSSAIARLKDKPGKDLIKYGTTRLDDTLVRDHLAPSEPGISLAR